MDKKKSKNGTATGRDISLQDMKLLLKSIKDDRHRLGIALMAYGGLRATELCRLRVSDLRLTREFMLVHGRGAAERAIPLSRFLSEETAGYLTRHGDAMALGQDSYLLGGTAAEWQDTVSRHSQRLFPGAGICCEDLRACFAASLSRHGLEPERICGLLGLAGPDSAMARRQFTIQRKGKPASSSRERRQGLLGKTSSFFKRNPFKKIINTGPLIARERELAQLNDYIARGCSVVLLGEKGCGKSAILKQVENAIYIGEYRKKQSLVDIVLRQRGPADDEGEDMRKALKKLTVDELLDEIAKIPSVIVIDDIADLPRSDRKTISSIAKSNVVAAATTRRADIKLFRTYMEIRPLRHRHFRQILSEMFFMNNQTEKERIIGDIIHRSGMNLKEAVYITSQLSMGKGPLEIDTDEIEANQISIAPAMLIVVLFFAAWVLKSYATSMVALSYALLLVFRLVFMRYFFMPANRKRRS